MLCLQKQNNCLIKCKKLLDDFIDCVDKYRIEIIKEKIIENETNRNQEDDIENNFVKIQ